MNNRLLFSFSAMLASVFLLSSCSSDDEGSAIPPITEYEGFTLVWSDEFDGSVIDGTNWTYETGDGTDFGLPAGWGNSELQLYTTDASNSSIQQDGDLSVLAITALDNGDGTYSSTKMTTRDLRSIRYGKIEASIKLPAGQGLWPAFWALGDNFQDPIDWPGCGEIDIMEMLGNNVNTAYSTIHYTNSGNTRSEVQGTSSAGSSSFADDYHLFTLDWSPEFIRFYTDGILVNDIAIEDDMKEFQRSFYLILNLAVGGNWPGSPDASTSFPATMMVDYVRVYQWDDLQADPPPALDIAEETLGQYIDPSLATQAISESFTELGEVALNIYGGGGEPDVASSDEAIDGANSLRLSYPGTNWGGAFFEMSEGLDFSSYASGELVFALHYPSDFKDAEVKLESSGQASAAAVFLVNYTPTDLGDGWVEYRIPMTDFQGLDLSDLRIPFALWNPTNQDDTFLTGDILVDNLRLEQ